MFRIVLVAIIAYVLGLVSYASIYEPVTVQQYATGVVLPPTLCALHQFDDLHKHLPDNNSRNIVRDLRTLDNENAVVILHGTSVYEIKFATFRSGVEPNGCQPL